MSDIPDWNKVQVNADEGGRHRALVLAEALHEAGLWDGATEVFFPDPYDAHRRWSTARFRGLTVDRVLAAGTDYVIGDGVAPEAPRVRLEAADVDTMAAQLREEGWHFVLSASPGYVGFWMHRNGVSVNRSGGCFTTYREATRRAYHSATRKSLVEGHC